MVGARVVASALLVLCCLVGLGSLAGAVSNKYVEDFNTTTYRDQANTTALWDTIAGELGLPPFEVTLVGSCDIPGNAEGLAISGDSAYIAVGSSGIQVIDITDPASPHNTGYCYTLDYAYDVAISGDYAYVADGDSGLQVMILAGYYPRRIVGSYDTPGCAYDVAISGDCAYVADGDSGLQVIDITSPASPMLAGSCGTPGCAKGLAISGGYAYVADGYSGLQVIDITNPASPMLAGSYSTSGFGEAVVISGDYAYVADASLGLAVIDITDPESPTLAGSYATPGDPYDLAVSGDCVCVADCGPGLSGLRVIDITNPASPTLEGSYDMPDHAQGVAIDGAYAYVSANLLGLQVISVTSPAIAKIAGSCGTPGNAYDVTISGDCAYVADGNRGLQVIDITDPSSPTLEGSCDTPTSARSVAISGDCAYVADYFAGLQVVDITNPASPAAAGSLDTPGQARCVVVDGDYAYVADGGSGLQVIDITDPESPVLAGSCDTPGSAEGVAISGDSAYVADGGSGLQVIDITNPASPTRKGSCGTPGLAHAVTISGNYAYVADDLSGLQVISIEGPGNPTLVASYLTDSPAYDVAISGDFACLANGASGLQFIYVGDPTGTMYSLTCDTPGDATGVAIDGDYAYVADYSSGLQLIEVFQRRYDAGANIAQSLAIDGSSDTIFGARLSSIQTDGVFWKVSANGGTNWINILPDGAWKSFLSLGSDLRWCSSHYYTSWGVNPACTHLEIEWILAFPVVRSVVDIPNDQGRQVRLTWTRSGLDCSGSSTPITGYAIFRRIDAGAASPSALESFPRVAESSVASEEGQGRMAYPPGEWDFVGTVPAYCEDSYSTVVPTLADSTSQGLEFTAFFVRAATATPSYYYDSPVDSGYSVDNLAPAPPTNLRMTSPTDLAWDESGDDDFKYFTVYGSDVPGLGPAATLISYTIGTTMDVSSAFYGYYHVTATDFAGNEGEASSVENAHSGIYHCEDTPTAFALAQSHPNPFPAETSIGFDLPVGCAVTIRVIDPQGRQVKMLVDQVCPAGHHSVTWAGEDDQAKPVGPGIYFVRMDVGDFQAATKVLLTR